MFSDVAARLARVPESARDPVFGAGHGWQLRPCWPEERIAAFEARWSVSLPPDYRAFLRDAGAGGAGPAYGLVEIDERAELAALREPFDVESGRGSLTIATLGCGMDVLLVVSGPLAGRIFIDDRVNGRGIYSEAELGFAEWYAMWLVWVEAGAPRPQPERPRVVRGRPRITRSLDGDDRIAALQRALDAPGGTDLGALGRVGRHNGRSFFKQGPALGAAGEGAALDDASEIGRLLASAIELAKSGVAVALADLFVLWLDEASAWTAADYLGRPLAYPAKRWLVIQGS
jgi:hypothetical protein